MKIAVVKKSSYPMNLSCPMNSSSPIQQLSSPMKKSSRSLVQTGITSWRKRSLMTMKHIGKKILDRLLTLYQFPWLQKVPFPPQVTCAPQVKQVEMGMLNPSYAITTSTQFPRGHRSVLLADPCLPMARPTVHPSLNRNTTQDQTNNLSPLVLIIPMLNQREPGQCPHEITHHLKLMGSPRLYCTHPLIITQDQPNDPSPPPS
jgi:hypothetical protein